MTLKLRTAADLTLSAFVSVLQRHHKCTRCKKSIPLFFLLLLLSKSNFRIKDEEKMKHPKMQNFFHFFWQLFEHRKGYTFEEAKEATFPSTSLKKKNKVFKNSLSQSLHHLFLITLQTPSPLTGLKFSTRCNFPVPPPPPHTQKSDDRTFKFWEK